MKHFWIFILLVFSFYVSLSQIPTGYYDSADGLTGEQLRSELHEIIKNPQVTSYSGLWTAFQSTDKKPNGKVWDMYSDIPDGTPAYEYSFGSDQCGSYSAEGQCYNREHSVPASWFNDASPMYSDLFHLYPTDGYVNNRRSNYPFGKVASPTWTSTNGSKLGSSAVPGYTGTVFEPIDAYKGDFARTYFYMVTCYMDKVQNWSSPMFSGNNLSSWAINMLLQWHEADPVSEKEINRNNAVYQIQHNRNPYIDNPEWVLAVWDSNYEPSKLSNRSLTYFSVYPNPFSNNIKVNSLETLETIKISKLEILNISGQCLKSVAISDFSRGINIETNELPEGFYILRIKSEYFEQNFRIVKVSPN
ncbi:MAG TPA: endonuclease [Bacteroidales bacterium]|nr:endonuclease [Bacteroidales bacterium]HOL97801.1 endonuclease [Bacteroidales bacterium]HOM35850.1 endonuclease [Bacteroidales bacterium]HPD23231.1 endonuclease [Bacteroidales bacterium]HRS99235.1 endonuclease [Bacteroidales bacterium]